MIDERGCQGPPDWIIEILTKSTAYKDLHEKSEAYQRAGVREYWVEHSYTGVVAVQVFQSLFSWIAVRKTFADRHLAHRLLVSILILLDSGSEDIVDNNLPGCRK